MADAQLVWEKERLDLRAAPQDKNVSVDYKFKNSGEYPVSITQVRPSCGCTVAQSDKKNYLPREEGVIKVTFQFGERVGLQQKEILVSTDDANHPQTVLTLIVDIPKVLDIRPAFLFWQAGRQEPAKNIHIKVLQEFPIRISSVHSSDGRFVPKLKTVKEGQEYNIVVRVKDLKTPTNAVLKITALLPGGESKTYDVPAFIKPSKSESPAAVLPKGT